jgi:ribulose-5-phosphate 4-epimerase/fuculose-1-phosphate aldolase
MRRLTALHGYHTRASLPPVSDDRLRRAVCRAGKLLVRRGLVHGTTGNISVRTAAGYILTPTRSALDRLDPDGLSALSPQGDHVGGDPPTKEFRLHLAVYAVRPSANAVVHTHSLHSVAVSLLRDVDRADMLPALTPYYVMRVGRCAVSPYRIPGDEQLAADIAALASDYHAVVLAHHGPVVAGPSLDDAIATLEELEATARLYLALYGRDYAVLDAAAVGAIRERYPPPAP